MGADQGHIVLIVLGMIAQMERRFIEERQREGITRAKAAGASTGGKPRLDHAAIRRMASEGYGPSAIAAAFGCSRMQVYRVLERP